MKRTLCMILGLILAAPQLQAPACIHKPADFDGSISQTRQGAIIFWHGGREELILKNDFRINPGKQGQLPASLAWVVPVPTVPDNYSVEKLELFRDMRFRWSGEWFPDPSIDSPPEKKPIKLLKRIRAGEYEIQPIKTTGDAGAKALNAWLKKNGYGEVPVKNMAYYVKHDWIWLAVKVALKHGTQTVIKRGGLRPLRISFASKDLVYPVMFSSHQGVFGVDMWIVTEKPIKDIGKQVAKFRFNDGTRVDLREKRKEERAKIAKLRAALAAETNAKKQRDIRREIEWKKGELEKWALPKTVEAVQAKAAKEGHWKVLEAPVIQYVYGYRVNSDFNPLSKWKVDFRIKVVADEK